MHPQPSRLVAWRKTQPRTEIEQDVGGLADHELAGAQERWRERRAFDALSVDELHHRRHAAFATARHVDIVGAGLLQRQPHELAAPLDRRPVVELVAHRTSPIARAAYAALSRGRMRSAFSRSIAMRSAPLNAAASPLV